MPGPSSATSAKIQSGLWGSSQMSKVTPPFSVNLMAFPNKLVKICNHLSTSMTRRFSSKRQPQFKNTPFSSASRWCIFAMPEVTSTTLTLVRFTVGCPISNLDKSNTSSTT